VFLANLSHSETIKPPKILAHLKSCGKIMVIAFLDVFHIAESDSGISLLQKKIILPSAKFDVFVCPQLYYILT
jgi:hypothetical protein